MDENFSSSLVSSRRKFHRSAEPGWCEFQTASTIIARLRLLGCDVEFGQKVVSPKARFGLPPESEINVWAQRALDSGCDPKTIEELGTGFTGVVGTFKGTAPGPIVALRFDIDANYGHEAGAPSHRPAREGFVSRYPEAHHNCGHDGHVAIGLAIADVISKLQRTIRGEIRLIFQPAEEGLRGANAMVAAGVLQGVDLLIGCHIGVQAGRVGQIITGYHNILASTKYDVHFLGAEAHAALAPQVGRNALLAACMATQALYSVAQHGDGETRMNVGIMRAGVSRNTVPGSAFLAIELRAETNDILSDLDDRARKALHGAGACYGVEVRIDVAGSSCVGNSSSQGVEIIARAAANVSDVTEISGPHDFKACDDIAVMMDAVQRQGGIAVYFGLGTELPSSHHNPHFDFNEACLPIGVEVFMEALRQCGAIEPT